jgi:peptidoglycan/LPS O-acetylase OafA/YrhL
MNYRRDIDGLRAVAVLAVMFFHFGMVGVSGGYVGVDIFFCISGYLIGGIIIDETASGTFSYVQFYVRRIKRLYPAFLAVILVAVPMAWWLLLPVPDFQLFGKSLIAATIYLPNIFYYRELGGYFGGNAATMPLLHTWSLGVEEQFYIFFPLLMRFAVRERARFTGSMLALTGILSLSYAQHRLGYDPMSSFYWLPTRAWELLLGAFVALPNVRDQNISIGLGRTLSSLAVAAIILPILFYTDSTPFPGMTALVPCLGATWLLWWGRNHNGGLIPYALMARAPVIIGRMSYSLYLWHWPVYVFLAYHLPGEIPWPTRLLALLFVFVVAALSWRFVEQPARLSKLPPAPVFGIALIGSVLIAGVGFGIWRSDGMPGRLSGDTLRIATAAKDYIHPGLRCVPADNPHLPGLSHCRLGLQGAPEQFLIWGDSHARAIRDGADQVASEHGLAGLLVWAAGCMPAFDYVKRESVAGPQGDSDCAKQNSAIKILLAKHGTIKRVLLVGRWAYYTEGGGIGIDQRNRIRIEAAAEKRLNHVAANVGQATVVRDVIIETVRWMREQGYEVFLLEQFPEFPEFSGDRLFQLVRSGQDSLQGAIARIGTVQREQVEARQHTANEILQQAVLISNARVLSTHDLFCGTATCSVWFPSGQAYLDNNHLTVTASRKICPLLLPAMGP